MVKVSFKAKAAETVTYKIEHWQQNLTGNDYTKVDTETKHGKPDENTQAAAKTYEGFTSKAVTQVKIKADGSTAVKIDYDRKEITLTLNLDGGTTTTPLTDGTLKGRFGADVPAVASPAKEGYEFKSWTPALPAKFPAENKTHTAQWKINEYPVTFSVEGGNGTLKATPEGGAETATSPISVEHGKTVTFTATAETDYKVEKWTVTPAEALKEGGSEGSITAKVKITGEATVKVSFKRDYKSVAFADLDNYLKTATPASDGIYYIEVTGLTAADLKGDADAGTASPLGKVLNDNPTKKVALKLPKTIEGLTDMSASFFDCRSLVSVKEIPQGVTAMRQCFQGCENLKDVPALPQGVQDIFHCFVYCDNLTKVPALPESVKDMSYCFKNCANLKEVAALPDSVTNMDYCFAECKKLEKVAKLPANVKNMIHCFEHCESLKEVPELPQNLEDMTGCFKSCFSLTKAPEIPATVKNMEDCFSGCTSLVQAPTKIPEGVTNMNACFDACVKLENVPEIPATVEKMGFCFSECRALKGVVLKCEYKNGNYNYTFEHCEKLEDGGIKVPAAYYDAYTAEDALNAMKVPGDDADAKKAKFAKIE